VLIEVLGPYGPAMTWTVDPPLTVADIDYIRSNYVPLEEACAERRETPDRVRALIDAGRLPDPSYWLPDGTAMVPADYFRLLDDAGSLADTRTHFSRRFLAAGGNPAELDEEWRGYLSGLYGVCLREVTPETIVRKTALVDSLTRLLDEPRPDDGRWRRTLREQVDELDALERDFSPDYDRARFDVPPTRDRLIVAAREQYL
jgi:Family of unknown function (DUF6058)